MKHHLVTVFGFRIFDQARGDYLASQYKAPLDAIKRWQGAAIEGSAEEVERTLLDENDRYLPRD
jgi:hypothetical protein